MKNLIIECIKLGMYSEAKILTEMWYNYFKTNTSGGYTGITIFVNPSEEEISKNIPQGSRAFIDLDGNLYCEGYEIIERGDEIPKEAQILHETFIHGLGEKLEYLQKLGDKYGMSYWQYKKFIGSNMIKEYGVAVVLNTQYHYLGLATYYGDLLFYDNVRQVDEAHAEIQKLYDKCKIKNPIWDFKMERF